MHLRALSLKRPSASASKTGDVLVVGVVDSLDVLHSKGSSAVGFGPPSVIFARLRLLVLMDKGLAALACLGQHCMPYSLTPMRILPLLLCCSALPLMAEENLGTLVFSDEFERKETQELKDEPGNGWKTSSSWSAKGNKEVALLDGALYIYIHPEAIHAVDVGHDFSFVDGTAVMRFKFHEEKDTLMLNFADLSCKEVHAGHLCAATFGAKKVTLQDMKTGGMLLKYYDARKAGTLSKEDQELIKTKSLSFPNDISVNEWHKLKVTIVGDLMTASVDDKEIGSFSSPGIAHESKQVLRLLVSNKVTIDDVKYYRLK